MNSTVTSVTVVLLAAALAPVIATALRRAVRVPVVVFEIVLGMLVGQSVLGWVKVDDVVGALADFGLIMLFFMAGNEFEFARVRGRSLNRAALGWLISLAAGILVGVIITGSVNGVYIGVALSSTALGTIMPSLRDSGELSTRLGRAIVAVGAVGEFLPLVAISIFLSGRQPLVGALVLIAFVVVAGLAIWFSERRRIPGLDNLVAASLGTSAQFGVRLVLVLAGALVMLSVALGLDLLLGAFTAGILARALLRGASRAHAETLERKFEAVSFGVFVPIFFVVTGATFDFTALFADVGTVLLVPAFVIALLVVRGLPGLLAAPPRSNWSDRRTLGLFSATGLPIIVAVTGIALDQNDISPGIAAALVGAGTLSVLLFPLLALVRRRPSREEPVAAERAVGG